jgi:hypothetical protein
MSPVSNNTFVRDDGMSTSNKNNNNNHKSEVPQVDNEHDPDPESDDIQSNSENNTNNSNLEYDTVENNIEANPNPSTIDDSHKVDLDTLPYALLKDMCNDRASRDRYGDEALLTATWKADFNRMNLKQLRAIPRDEVPEELHAVLDEVIYTKNHAALSKIDRLAYKARFPGPGIQHKHWRFLEYKDNGKVVNPPPHLR